MSVRAAKYGKRIGEVPAGEPPRIGGQRKLQVLRWGAAYYFQIWKERFFPLAPDPPSSPLAPVLGGEGSG